MTEEVVKDIQEAVAGELRGEWAAFRPSVKRRVRIFLRDRAEDIGRYDSLLAAEELTGDEVETLLRAQFELAQGFTLLASGLARSKVAAVTDKLAALVLDWFFARVLGKGGRDE